ncbi:MAG: HAD family hydrolase [Acidobacteriota bacterium]|nr:HAD family hydrolase [Acidobacteriota bacterium]
MKADWFFFDLDGTLADSLPGLEASIVEALASGGRALRVENLRPYIGPGIRTILKNLEPELTEQDLDGMERAFRASYDGTGVRNTQLFEGAKSTLERLRAAGAELFLVTNKPKLATATLLEQHGMAGLFRDRVSRNSREPAYATKGEMLVELVRRHGVEVDRAVMVGDTAEDMHAARDAGMRFAFVEYGYGEVAGEHDCMRLQRIADLPAACGHGQPNAIEQVS